MYDEKIRLNDFILQYFSLGEVRDLCFRLGVDFDDLDGSTRKDKARELVAYMSRRQRLADLGIGSGSLTAVRRYYRLLVDGGEGDYTWVKE